MTGLARSGGNLHLSADALHVLTAWQAPDAQQEALRSSYVALLRERSDAVWRTCVPAHLTASALVLDARHRRVLLTLHRKGAFWAQLGGHCEVNDDTLAAAALREAVEESGISDLRLVADSPVDLDRHALPAAFGTCGEHLDVRFVAVAPDGAAAVRTSESTELRWFDAERLPADAVDDLSRLVRRSLDRAVLPG